MRVYSVRIIIITANLYIILLYYNIISNYNTYVIILSVSLFATIIIFDPTRPIMGRQLYIMGA